MKVFLTPLLNRWRFILGAVLILGLLSVLYFYRLGTLMPGLSHEEVAQLSKPIGWHGLYSSPFNLPWRAAQSAILKLQPDAGDLLVRLPSACIGVLAVILFGMIIKVSNGTRTVLTAAPLFATAAWTLHASRLATTDSLYLLAVPLLLGAHVGLQRFGDNAWVRCLSLATIGLMLYTPGIIWLGLATVIFLGSDLREIWDECDRRRDRIWMFIAGIWWLPLLIFHFIKQPHDILTWLGLPAHYASGMELVKQFVGVPVHMFIRGPEYPYIWLGKSPVLDSLTLIACLLGIYFYARRLRASRSKLLFTMFIMSIILIGFNGPVQFSLVVPLLYIFVAGGIAYLLREWLQVFPVNPFARTLGVLLIAAAVILSCVYNVRAYFIAWPHNDTAVAAFQNHR